MANPFHTLSIRYKLLYGYGLAFILAIILGNGLLYIFIRNTIEMDIEQELRNTTESIINMVEIATDVSIRNHLRGLAEENRDVVAYFYNKQLSGKLTEKEAKARAAEAILSQTIGATGYIYSIDSTGAVQFHPDRQLVDVDLSKFGFITQQKMLREGYIEYNWADPDEPIARPKALYMTYFEPWDWIISACAYRSEFKGLFDAGDFREAILSITFGKTGYPYVIDSLGNLIIHPKLEGTNVYDSTDTSGRMFIKELCTLKRGKLFYPWQNPGEPKPREKIVVFDYIPELDWIVASSSYLEEFPLRTIGYIALGMVLFTLALIIPITLWLSSSITRPVQDLITGFAQGAEGDYSNQIDTHIGGEVGQLAAYYNKFMDQLNSSHKSLEESEEKYRGIFENAAEGVFQTSAEGGVISANPAMARILGFPSPKELIAEVTDIQNQLYVDPRDRDVLLETLYKHGAVFNFETRLKQPSDRIIWVSLNVRVVKDEAGSIRLIEGLLSDITQRKESEEALRETKEELEQRVVERTTELSSWVAELEKMNIQRSQLQDMGRMIQLCRSVEETFPIILQFLENMFPGDEASLYIHNEQTALLELVNPESEAIFFEKEECWALRQGKSYEVDAHHLLPRCDHVHSAPHGYTCTPLVSQGELIGLIHIAFGTPQGDLDEEKQQLAGRIADNAALALANLRLRETLRLQSIQDPLTSLYNRRFMEKAISQEISRSLRRERAFGILMIDIDHFKQVNDTHGHEAGDAVLKEIGAYLLANVRSEDMPCRYGGEEFAIIINEVSLENLQDKALDLCSGIAKKILVPTHGTKLRITVSIGAALFPIHGSTAQTVLKAADHALYQAKENGRNQVVMAEVE